MFRKALDDNYIHTSDFEKYYLTNSLKLTGAFRIIDRQTPRHSGFAFILNRVLIGKTKLLLKRTFTFH